MKLVFCLFLLFLVLKIDTFVVILKKYFMQLFYNPKPIDNTISEIKRKFRKLMNGEISSTMQSMGSVYRVNYGIEYLRLKNLASQYPQNSDLSERLWNLTIRETMIMATLLQPVDEFSKEQANRWLEKVNQPELVEYYCMNLLSKLDFAPELVLEWINSDNVWKKITGFILSARIYQQFTDLECQKIIDKGYQYSLTDNLHLYKSIALSLSRICRVNKEVATKINKIVEEFETSDVVSKQYIAHQVSTEMSFLSF